MPLSRLAATPFFTARSGRNSEHEHCSGQRRVCSVQTDLEPVVRKDLPKSGTKRDLLPQRETALIPIRFLYFVSGEGDRMLFQTSHCA